MAQLVEWLLPIPKVRSSNPVIVKNIYWTFTVNCTEKTKIKKKRPRITHFLKKIHKKVSVLYHDSFLFSFCLNVWSHCHGVFRRPDAPPRCTCPYSTKWRCPTRAQTPTGACTCRDGTLAEVGPDVKIKSSPILTKSCPKSRHSCYTLKGTLLKTAPKVQNIWANFLRKFVA